MIVPIIGLSAIAPGASKLGFRKKINGFDWLQNSTNKSEQLRAQPKKS